MHVFSDIHSAVVDGWGASSCGTKLLCPFYCRKHSKVSFHALLQDVCQHLPTYSPHTHTMKPSLQKISTLLSKHMHVILVPPAAERRTWQNGSAFSRRGTGCWVHAQAAAGPPSTLPPKQRPRLAVFVSGGGSNFKRIHAAILDLTINADIAVKPSPCPPCMSTDITS